VEYFGQTYKIPSCRACDLCLGDTEPVPDALIVAQKILSCVARVNEGFGITHVISVLRGENTENVRKWGHERLSTYGLLRGHSKAEIRDWIYQLIGQEVLLQVGDEYPKLKLNETSWEVMRGQRGVRLVQLTKRQDISRAQAEEVSWEGVDRELFASLRELRRELAEERSVPPYVIVNDATLRALARERPSNLERMRLVSGIGDQKLRNFGERFLQVLDEQCRARGLSRNQRCSQKESGVLKPQRAPSSTIRPNLTRNLAWKLFRRGETVDEVVRQTGRARSTIVEYLARFIQEERPSTTAAWVSDEVYQRVAGAARRLGTQYLKPLYIALGEKVSYDDIRIVLAHLGGKDEG
jgi:ATP-dependent DNA helicase RecQ